MADESGFQLDDGSARQFADHLDYHLQLIDLMVGAVVAEGDAVLDVACGTGLAARAAAAVVGPTGRVVGADISSEMIEVARTVPDVAAVPITWYEASALDMPFADAEFDVVVSSQGVQFFPNPAAGLGEMARVTREGGRVAIEVWTPRSDTPFLDTQMELLVRHCGVDPAQVDAPFNDADAVRGWFEQAGLADLDLRTLTTEVSLPPVREFSPVHLSALPWSDSFRALDAAARDAALTFAEDRLADYRSEHGLVVPFRSFLAVATI